MKHYIKYTLCVDFDAMQKALDAYAKGEKAYNCAWVDIESPIDEEEGSGNYCSVTFPDSKYPQVTRSLFWNLVCHALPCSTHPDTGLHIHLWADHEGEDGRTRQAFSFMDSYQPDWERQRPADHNGTFTYDGAAFSQELQQKIDQIARICRKGGGYD